MPPENGYLARVEARIAREPERCFAQIWLGDQRIGMSWGELGRRAQGFAAAYKNAGVAAGDIVFLILRHGPDLYPAFLGAMLAGAIPSFLPFPSAKQDSDIYWSTHIAVFARTGARLLVTYGELADALRQRTDGTVAVLDTADVEHAGDRETFVAPPRAETAIALLQHSSGTTGLKKGVALSFRAIRLQIESYAKRLGLDPDRHVIASWLPLYHDMGLVACFLMPMYLGIKIVSLDAFEWTTRPSLLLDAIEASRASHAWLPNFAFAHIARATPKRRSGDLRSVQALIGCSEPNKPAVFDLFVDRFAADGMSAAQAQCCYAMAETVFALTQTEIGTEPRRLTVRVVDGRAVPDSNGSQTVLSNGRPLPDVDLGIIRDGAFADEGRIGEICARAPFLFDGYFNDPETTAAACVDGFFRTGDLGFLFEGELFILGRTKELIIVNGRNFFANDIESAVSDVAGVKRGRCVAFGLYMPSFGAEQIVVLAEPDPDQPDALDATAAVATALNARLGTSPADVRLVAPGWLVKTTSGKLSRAENIRKYVREFRPDLDPSSSPEAAA